MGPPTRETAVERGGWDARHARCLLCIVAGDVAMALVDTNGDGAAIDADLYACAGGAGGDDWRELSSRSADDHGTAWAAGVRLAWGRAPGAENVGVVHAGEVHRRPVDDHGFWWMAVAADLDSPEGDRFSRLW